MILTFSYVGLDIYGLTLTFVAFAVERLLAELAEGSHLYKVKSSTKLLQRQFFLDTKNMVLYYKGSRRKGRNTDSEYIVGCACTYTSFFF